MLIWTGLVFLPVTVILWVLSYLLIVKKRADLVAGFDPAKIRDPDKYSVWVGYAASLCGVGLLGTWVLIAAEILAPRYMLPGVIISATVTIILAIFGSLRYSSR